MANWGLLQGLGQGMQQFGGRMMEAEDRKAEEAAYMRKVDYAERARGIREQADRDREALLAKTTPVSRDTFLGSADDGPPQLKYAKRNRAGDMIESGAADEAEQSQYRSGLLGESRAQQSAAAKEAEDKRRFDTLESGRNQRNNARINAPKGESTAAKPSRMEFREVVAPDGSTQIHGFDPHTGELKTINGRPVRAGAMDDPLGIRG